MGIMLIPYEAKMRIEKLEADNARLAQTMDDLLVEEVAAMSEKNRTLVVMLEEAGYVGVVVNYEPLGKCAEMCGPSGGWSFTAENGGDCLGVTYVDALRGAIHILRFESLY